MTNSAKAAALLRGWADDPASNPAIFGELRELFPEAARTIGCTQSLIDPEAGLVRVAVDSIERYHESEYLLRYAAGEVDPQPIPPRAWIGASEHDRLLRDAPDAKRRAVERVRCVAELLGAMPTDLKWIARWNLAILHEAEARNAVPGANAKDLARLSGEAAKYPDAARELAEAELRHTEAREAIDRLLREAGSGEPATPSPSPTGDDEAQPPALTRPQRIVLGVMAERSAEERLHNKTIFETLNPDDWTGVDVDRRLSRNPIAEAVNFLIKHGYAERDDGERNGARLTIRGRRLAARLGAE